MVGRFLVHRMYDAYSVDEISASIFNKLNIHVILDESNDARKVIIAFFYGYRCVYIMRRGFESGSSE